MTAEEKTLTLTARERWEVVALSAAHTRRIVELLQFAKPAVAKDLKQELNFWTVLRDKVI